MPLVEMLNDTQELVNLLLLGRAHSNVFDGQQTLGSTPSAAAGTTTASTATAASATAANCDEVVLRGITHRGPVGFLTLFEAYGHAAVGDCYKCPLHPVWVVCSESHYSVLFATQAQPVEVSINGLTQH
jgi:ubiquitin carboxyl-terminal hydrolase MINDY-3/4